MTKDEVINILRDCQESSDNEAAHIVADNALCDFLVSLGHEDIVKEFNNVGKWYS